MKRYARVTCSFDDATMLARIDTNNETPDGVLPPLLPFMLAACASSAVLTLDVYGRQGEHG